MNNEKNLYQRINGVMSELSYLKKTETIGYGNNSYTAIGHDHVTESLQPFIVKYGLVLEPSMINTVFERYQVTTRKGDLIDRYETQTTASLKVTNVDNPSEYLTVQATAHSFDSQDKAPGKAYSMAVKYCYLKLFMLASGDEEESRVEQAKVLSDVRQKLENKLIELLMSANKYDSGKTEMFIKKLSIDQLENKVKEYDNAK